VRQYGTAAQNTLMMEAQGTSETLDYISISTLLVAQKILLYYYMLTLNNGYPKYHNLAAFISLIAKPVFFRT
jgi:hypothetical protein